jgi:NADP-dependent 3-hydroxy acid dehydrogenase YdfG
LEEIKKKCQNNNITIIQTDVSDENSCKNLIEKAIETNKKIDILILNAGIGSMVNFEDEKDLNNVLFKYKKSITK